MPGPEWLAVKECYDTISAEMRSSARTRNVLSQALSQNF